MSPETTKLSFNAYKVSNKAHGVYKNTLGKKLYYYKEKLGGELHAELTQ